MQEIEISKKTVTCPLCKHEFTSTRVATTKLKLIKTDTDLRPYYKGIDTVPYEITTCENCGYSNFYNEFPLNLSKNEIDVILQKLNKAFKPKTFPTRLTNEDGIEKYKLAIIVAKLRNSNNSILSNLYMKLSWLLRNEKGSEKMELACTKYAYELGKIAFKEEPFPVLGINKSTFSYLLGDFARRLGKYDEAKKWLKNASSFQETSLSLKDRVIDVTSLIDKEIEIIMKEKLATKDVE